MKIDRDLFARFIRQQAELAGGELMLDSLTGAEFIRLLRAARAGGAAVAPAPARAAVAAPTRDPAASPHQPQPTPPRRGPGPGTVGLQLLAAEAEGCTRCGLAEGRTNVVFGVGSSSADLVVVGEAPGAEEDRTGLPFVGRAGKLLDLLLLTGGFPREQVYICNVIKCRPPDNRDPRPDEVEACSSFLHRQLEAIQPRVLLAVGKFAAQTLAGSEESIGKLRGRVHSYRGIPLVATYHPAFLLRSPQWMRAAWKDIQLVREVLDA